MTLTSIEKEIIVINNCLEQHTKRTNIKTITRNEEAESYYICEQCHHLLENLDNLEFAIEDWETHLIQWEIIGVDLSEEEPFTTQLETFDSIEEAQAMLEYYLEEDKRTGAKWEYKIRLTSQFENGEEEESGWVTLFPLRED